MFVVEADHPDGSSVPHTWVSPDPPFDQVWASALQTVDTQRDTLCVSSHTHTQSNSADAPI